MQWEEQPTAMDNLSELKFRLKKLKEQRKLMTKALSIGVFFAILVWISLTGKVALVFFGDDFIRSTQYLFILGILITGLLVYFAFVFRRVIKLKGEISKTKKSLELEAGSKDGKHGQSPP